MVNFLSSWVKNLSLAIIVVSILEMLLPNNKTKKYVKMVMGLYILFSIISPFIKNSDKLNFENIDVSSYINEELDTSNVEVNQESMDKRLKEIYAEELENDIIEYIEYYNNRRIKSKLKGMSPVQYREHSELVA